MKSGVCDCGRPSTQRGKDGWVCDLCRMIDSNRAAYERSAKIKALHRVSANAASRSSIEELPIPDLPLGKYE